MKYYAAITRQFKVDSVAAWKVSAAHAAWRGPRAKLEQSQTMRR